MSNATTSTGQQSNKSIAERCDDIAVRFERVSKRFNAVNALCDVSLAVRRGEFMTLLGPSGCGKTTLLNLAAGFFSPDDGQIIIAESLVNGVPTYPYLLPSLRAYFGDPLVLLNRWTRAEQVSIAICIVDPIAASSMLQARCGAERAA